jgi:Trk-type K+ transport system membrane component
LAVSDIGNTTFVVVIAPREWIEECGVCSIDEERPLLGLFGVVVTGTLVLTVFVVEFILEEGIVFIFTKFQALDFF